MIIAVTDTFRPYADTAIARLCYLYPGVGFELTSKGIEVRGDSGRDAATLTREVQYVLYREKIYIDTLPLRAALIDAVTRR